MRKWQLDTTSACKLPARAARRRGISLLEVLISMFVLAIGLMGVAALIPAGRHEIVEAIKLENAAMVGRSAFRDIQIREYLNPENWWDPYAPKFVFDKTNVANPFHVVQSSGTFDYGSQVAFVIDPLGLTASTSYGNIFPYNGLTLCGPMPLRPVPLRRILPFRPASTVPANMRAAFDTVFRGSFDQVTQPNTANKDLPPNQQYFNNGGTYLRRASDGNYSWMATVVSDPTKSALDAEVTVSVAVFYKRTLLTTTDAGGSPVAVGEYISQLNTFPVLPMTSGGQAILSQLPNDTTGKMVSVKPGQWIMLGGRQLASAIPTPTYNYFYHWYRVLSAAPANTSTQTQQVTLAGHDWSISNVNSRAWIFDNIVSVYEKNLPLEFE